MVTDTLPLTKGLMGAEEHAAGPRESRFLRGYELALSPSPVQLVEQEFRSEVGAIGPLKGMEVGIEREPLEEFEVAQRLENSARKLIREVDFALSTVVVTQPKAIFAHNAGADELWRCHSSGGIG